MPEYRTLAQHNTTKLIAGDFPIVTQTITIAAGQNLQQGAVLGRNKAGSYVLSVASASDGSKNPTVVLAEGVNATDKEREAVCYLSGQFNANALHFGEGHTPESTAHNLRILNIYLTNTL